MDIMGRKRSYKTNIETPGDMGVSESNCGEGTVVEGCEQRRVGGAVGVRRMLGNVEIVM